MVSKRQSGWVQIKLVTPFADLTVAAIDEGLCTVQWGEESQTILVHPPGRPFQLVTDGPVVLEEGRSKSPNQLQMATQHATDAIGQLWEYFQGHRKTFDLTLLSQGTEFQNDVWTALQSITYGQTCSYKHIAAQVGRPLAVRAVGQANRRNPFPVIVPCHRVMGVNGMITGYDGGKYDLKFAITQLEQAFINQDIRTAKLAQA